MPKQIVIAEQQRISAVFSEDQIQEIIVATGSHQVGDIYLGTVENILPGIDAAFINIGDGDKNGFMHVSDLGPLKLKRMAGSITELLAPQQKVLVQIMKEPTGNKGPRLTGKVTMPGRYLVLMPYGRGVNLSRRIKSETERNRLRALGILVKPAGMGLLIRTEAEGVSEDAIIEDLETLQRRWEAIQAEALSTRPPSLLNRDDDFIQRVLRDVYSDDVNRIVTDTESGLDRTKQHLASWSDGRVPAGILTDCHRESTPILEYFRVNAAIREALKPRVDLPSGGYIIIEPTEALTVIDVNSGSFTRSATSRETVLWTNCEAAVEIARQLRLRNIAGVIVVDFIDMDSRRDKMQVLEQFGTALRVDKSRPQISQLSELGLVELTRKRQGQNIYELFGRPCTTCGGLGHLVHLPGEEPDTAAQVSPVSSRPTAYSSPSQSFSSRPSAREDRAISLDPQAELQELDLVNHPNYQDKNGRGNRRRRRGRGTDSSSTRSPRPAPVTSATATADTKAPVKEKDRDKDKDERSQQRGGKADSSTDNWAEDKSESSAEGKSSVETSTRSKRTRNGRRKTEEPPEIIAVEMTPEEQRIYAMMGISPLTFSGQTAENPQTAVVAVVLPGEAADFMASATSSSETASSTKRVIDPPIQADAKAEPDQAAAPVTESDTVSLDSSEDADEDEEADKPITKSAPVKRRRRSPSQTPAAADADMADSEAAASSNGSGGSSGATATSLDTDSSEASEPSTESDQSETKVVRRRRRRSSAS